MIRPTGLIDPPVEVRPAKSQVDDVLGEIRDTTKAGYRTLVTVLTKRMAEDLTEYLHEQGIRVRYMHSDIDTLERIEILRDLGSARSTAWSASTCCAKASTFRNAASSPSSTPTRKAFCAPRPR